MWEIAFSKPGSVMRDKLLLEKAGIGVKRARIVVLTSFLLSLLLTLGIGSFILRIADIGEMEYILGSLLVLFLSHFQLAKLMVHLYKRKRIR